MRLSTPPSLFAYTHSFFNHSDNSEIFSLSVLRPLLFFFNDTATTEIYTLSLHDALPITSELQSRSDLVCRLLLEKKKKKMVPDWATQKARREHAQVRIEVPLGFTRRMPPVYTCPTGRDLLVICSAEP